MFIVSQINGFSTHIQVDYKKYHFHFAKKVKNELCQNWSDIERVL